MGVIAVNTLYEIKVESDKEKVYATHIAWKRNSTEVEQTLGKYFLRTSLSMSDEEAVWQIYNTIREVESTFLLLAYFF